VRVERAHLATLPDERGAPSIVISHDRKDHAFIAAGAEGYRVVHGGNQGSAFAEVTQPRFAPGTRELFYWAYAIAGDERLVTLVAGGKEIPTGLARAGKLVFSKNGERWAAIGEARPSAGSERGGVEIFVDGEHAGSYPGACLPALSHDNAHVAYLVEDESGRIKLLVDGRERRVFEPPRAGGTPGVEPGSGHANFMTRSGVTYLSDGSLLVLTRDGERWSVFRDEARLATYGDSLSGEDAFLLLEGDGAAATVFAGTIAVAESAPVAAWWERQARAEGRWRVVRNGEPEHTTCVRFWDSQPPVLSADGRHIAYVCPSLSASGVDETYVIHDGRHHGPYAGAWGLALSPDGERLAYAADDGSAGEPWSYYLDGKRRAMRFERVWPPRFSRDGKQLAWVAEKNGRVILFLNGSGRASSDRVVFGPQFRGNHALEWVSLRGRRLTRIDVTW
jgi:hypothetical protein